MPSGGSAPLVFQIEFVLTQRNVEAVITRLFITLAIALLTGCSTPPSTVPDRWIDLPLPEALPYALLAEKERRKTKMHLTDRECARVYLEVYGTPAQFDAPVTPPPYGPLVVKNGATGRVVANYLTNQGFLFEIVFVAGQPPRVEKSYFTDFRHTSRFPTLKAAIRFRYKQVKLIDDLIACQPQSAGMSGHRPPASSPGGTKRR